MAESNKIPCWAIIPIDQYSSDIQLEFESIEKQNAPSQCVWPTLIDDVMACALHNKWFVMSAAQQYRELCDASQRSGAGI